MKKTTTYQLNQWEKSDRIQMEDFNADNQKIETALAETTSSINSFQAAIPRIAFGNYTGSGSYGSSKKVTLTFDFTPKLVFVSVQDTSKSIGNGLFLIHGQTKSSGAGCSNSILDLIVSWESNSVSWYSTTSAGVQLNTGNTVYYYCAIGA